jgi:hypothetical protein
MLEAGREELSDVILTRRQCYVIVVYLAFVSVGLIYTVTQWRHLERQVTDLHNQFNELTLQFDTLRLQVAVSGTVSRTDGGQHALSESLQVNNTSSC